MARPVNTTLFAEDLVANAMIAKIERSHKQSITFKELNEFAKRVRRWWAEHKALTMSYSLSTGNLKEVMAYRADFFDIDFLNDTITLNSNKDLELLRQEFRMTISIDLIKSFNTAGEMFPLAETM